MTSVVNLAGDPASIAGNPELVEMLRELLARAESGGITAMGVAFVKMDGSVATRWEGGDQTVPMVAAISILHHEFMTGIGGGS